MRLDRIGLSNYPPIRSLEIDASSNVLIIAGANGSGKTRLKNALVYSFSQPNSPHASLTLSATRPEEEEAWGVKSLTVTAGQRSEALERYLSTRRGPNAYIGAVIQIDSDRAVQPVRFEQYTLATPDPDDQDVTYSWYLSQFIGRWQEVVNRIYRKLANRDNKLAAFIKANPARTGAEALAALPDPFLPYQEVFGRLLPGKTLEPIDPKAPREFHYRIADGSPMPFGSLSSGEQEVVKIAFDLIWKQITHSIILLDEPELHLHPTLAFRLIETLKDLGAGTNQLVLFTHSADLISTYFSTGNVFFIDNTTTESNQAQKLSTLTIDHAAVARSAGANLGLFAVGKRIVFVEGNEASVDRLVYHKVAQIAFPDAYVMPVGSVENITALRSVIGELGKAIFGIELFLIRDRDGLTDGLVRSLEENKRFRCLRARHVENYLLDENVLADVAKALYLPAICSDPQRIGQSIRNIATASLMPAVIWNVREHIRIAGALDQPVIRSPERLSLDEVIGEVNNQVSASLSKVSLELGQNPLTEAIKAEHARLVTALNSDAFKRLLPGKIIFRRLCAEFFNTEAARIREAYIDLALRSRRDAVRDILEIFESFAAVAQAARVRS